MRAGEWRTPAAEGAEGEQGLLELVRAAEAVKTTKDDFHNRLLKVVSTAAGWRIQVSIPK